MCLVDGAQVGLTDVSQINFQRQKFGNIYGDDLGIKIKHRRARAFMEISIYIFLDTHLLYSNSVNVFVYWVY